MGRERKDSKENTHRHVIMQKIAFIEVYCFISGLPFSYSILVPYIPIYLLNYHLNLEEIIVICYIPSTKHIHISSSLCNTNMLSTLFKSLHTLPNYPNSSYINFTPLI